MDYMTLPGASVKMFKKGETLINQGEAIRYVYYLIDGIVHRNVLTERGLETTLTIKSDHMKHEIEAVIGVLIIYSAEVDQPKVAQSSFIAKTDCKCIQIPVQSFLKYAYQDRDALESIVRYAMDNYPGFMTICSTTDYKMPANSANPDGYTIHTTNHLMVDGSYYYEGVEGVKTGSINEYYEYKDGAWDTANPKKGSMALVTTCKKKGSDGRGYRYMVVTLGAPYYDENGDKSNYSFKDHIALYDWAFSEFVYTNIVKMNEQVTQVDVKHGKDVDKVGICASEDYYTLLEKSLNKTTVSQNVKLYSERTDTGSAEQGIRGRRA